MKKLIEIFIEFETTPKKIWVNDWYLNRNWSWKRWRMLHPEAIAYKNKIIESILETKIKSWYDRDFLFENENWFFYEIDIEIKWTKIKDIDWPVKFIQDCMNWTLIKDDSKISTFDISPIIFSKWKWMNIHIILYEFNEEHYFKAREYRRKLN